MQRSPAPTRELAKPPRVRLIAFPYACANATCYRELERYLGTAAQVVTHELPGHGLRMREPLRRTMPDLVDDVIERARDYLVPPFAFYGHSFGAWLARDVAHRLAALELQQPTHLFVSGRRAPRSADEPSPLHLESSGTVRRYLAELGGTPQAVLNDPELMGLFERILRADLEALGTRDVSPLPALKVPFHLMLGTSEEVSANQASAWQLETTFPLSISYFPGGHFFIHDAFEQVAELIKNTLLRSNDTESAGQALP